MDTHSIGVPNNRYSGGACEPTTSMQGAAKAATSLRVSQGPMPSADPGRGVGLRGGSEVAGMGKEEPTLGGFQEGGHERD